MRHEGHNKSSEFLFQEKKYSSVLKPDNNSMILLYKSFKWTLQYEEQKRGTCSRLQVTCIT